MKKRRKRTSLKRIYRRQIKRLSNNKQVKYNEKIKQVAFEICKELYHQVNKNLFETMLEACGLSIPTYQVSAGWFPLEKSTPLDESVTRILSEHFPFRKEKKTKLGRKK